MVNLMMMFDNIQTADNDVEVPVVWWEPSASGLASPGQLVDTASASITVDATAAGAPLLLYMAPAINIRPLQAQTFPVDTPRFGALSAPKSVSGPKGEDLLRAYAGRFEQVFRPYLGPDERPGFEPEDLPLS